MITAVDTSVLLDVFLPDERHGPPSAQRLRAAYDRAAVLSCDVVYAELVPAFGDRAALDGVLREIGGIPSPIDTPPVQDHQLLAGTRGPGTEGSRAPVGAAHERQLWL